MLTMTRRLLLAFPVVLAAAGMAQAQDTPGVTEDTIKIGIPAPFSGPNASFGAAGYGVAAYYEHVNKQGGIHGRQFEVILSDTGCNEAAGIAAARRLISQDEVFLINGGVCSGVGLAMRPVIEESGVPWVISTAANQSISEPVADNIFHAIQTSRDYGNAMGRFAMSKPGTERIGIIAHTNEWAKGYRDPLVEYLKQEHGIEPVTEVTMERGSNDSTAQTLTLREADLDFIMVILYEPELAVFLRDANLHGLDVPKVGSLGADFLNTQNRLGGKEPMEGFYMVHQYRGLLDNPELAEFRDAIAENLPEGQSLTDFSFYGPGSAVAVVHVLEQIGPDLTREKFIEGMESLDGFETGILAGSVTFSDDNHQGVSHVNVVGYDENGELAVFSTWGEEAM